MATSKRKPVRGAARPGYGVLADVRPEAFEALLDDAARRNRTVRSAPAPAPPPAPPVRDDADPFGFDPMYERKTRSVLELLYSRWFRVAAEGLAHVPARGACLLVAACVGRLDGVLLKTAVKLEHPAARDVRWLTDDLAPVLGAFVGRLGAVHACRENVERLLAREALVAVPPDEAYVTLGVRAGAAIVPVGLHLAPRASRIRFGAPVANARAAIEALA